MYYYLIKIKTLFKLLILRWRKKAEVGTLHKCHLKGKISIGGGATVSIGSLMTEDNSVVCAVTGRMTIGKNVFVNRNSIIACRQEIAIGDNTIIGPNVCIYDHDHRISGSGRVKENDEEPYRESPIHIGKNVWIAANCVILRGTEIGDNSVIGAGCVVKGIIPRDSIVRNNSNLCIEPLRL